MASHCPCPREEGLGAKSNSFGHKTGSVQTPAGSLDKSLLSDTGFLLLSWEGQNNALGPFCQPRVCLCVRDGGCDTVSGPRNLTDGWRGGTFNSPCAAPPPHPGQASQAEPRGKKTAMKWDLRWLLGSLRVFLSVEGNKGKDNDTGGREGDGEWCG